MNCIVVDAIAQTDRLTLLDVTESGTRPRWFDTDSYEFACLLGSIGSQSERFLKSCSGCNQVISGQDEHDGCVIPSSLRNALSCAVFVRIKVRARGIQP